MNSWSIGQRCLSTGEPGLGLGAIKKIAGRTMEVLFPAAGVMRTYNVQNPPLHRVVFHVGDVISDRNGESIEVKEVKEQNGVLIYFGETGILPETELTDTLASTHPEQVLLAAQLQTPRSYAVRRDAWKLRHASMHSPSRGLVGARIELVPHQLYIADKVSQRFHPRVLLADEVGLGKTVEAGLIFHRQWVTNQAKRILVLTPESLVFQWLVELFRKFNSLFHLMDKDYRKSLIESQPDLNPYDCHQRFLQGLNTLLKDPDAIEDLLETQWDMVIVDEAHHLSWDLDGASEAYKLVEQLSRRTKSLILISATPRQLGLESHFALLRLLDPSRFPSLDAFLDETENLDALAQFVQELPDLDSEQIQDQIGVLFPEDSGLVKLAKDDSEEGKERLILALIDRHGTGRMVFRNRREVLENLLPQRKLHAYPLDLTQPGKQFMRSLTRKDQFELAQEALAGAKAIPLAVAAKCGLSKRVLDEAWTQDPRLNWLLDWLKENSGEKAVLICGNANSASAIQEWLFPYRDIETAVFHEGLSMVERDRQAAWFAQDDGATILICSEIGSEGRNFQFAHHLILFDLPFDPGLLEQRIGRLDRIGQHHEIQIHVPYLKDTVHERLFRWYREGLSGFEAPVRCADQLSAYLDEELALLLEGAVDHEEIIEQTKENVFGLYEILEKGRDILLEKQSYRRERATDLVQTINEDSVQHVLPEFMDRLFEILGLNVSEVSDSIQFVEPGSHMFIESYPDIPEEGVRYTFDRSLAVAREDLAFLTMDHPVVTSGIDLILTQDRGIASVGLWKQAPEAGLALQILFVLECPAKAFLEIERYLPATPIEVVVDQNLNLRPDLLEELDQTVLDKGPAGLIRSQRSALEDIFTRLIKVARDHARNVAEKIVAESKENAKAQLMGEHSRLTALQKLNPSVRDDELEYFEALEGLVQERLEQASIRMDAIRLILMKP